MTNQTVVGNAATSFEAVAFYLHLKTLKLFYQQQTADGSQ